MYITSDYQLTLYLSFSIDGSSGRYASLVNDAPAAQTNATMKVKVFDGIPRLMLFAIKNIRIGQEILTNMGDEVCNMRSRKQVSMVWYIFK